MDPGDELKAVKRISFVHIQHAEILKKPVNALMITAISVNCRYGLCELFSPARARTGKHFCLYN